MLTLTFVVKLIHDNQQIICPTDNNNFTVHIY